MSDFSFQCPFCNQSIEAPSTMMGQLVDCPGCGKPIEVAKKIPDWKRPPGRMPTSAPAKGRKMFMTTVRWIFFIPVAIVGGMATAMFFAFGSIILPDILRHVVSGIGTAGGTISIGLMVAPKRNKTVKWVLIALVIIFGALDALASIAIGEELKAVIGATMIFAALMFSTFDPEEMNKAN